ncbi:SDR family NAD(P)-dependent oxidoreductase [Empedobacter falsenii]|uniref:SDR family NAD(P)-dependent oxidoreductase n=1 Tax=Empedobacter falsenii TaxID=343874 RepID=UPI002578F44A|nr:SDR family NAD(P)-dependent oxidoreductase [Empedobacter falsenii]MDM1297968.1 SDR family NAD(P)-dependent oxidoreductase [Empedobacter falsenii]MDM1317957.1 SDR family NAD(P)-dependent oxidoreductase [Empedobacter falsenii]
MHKKNIFYKSTILITGADGGIGRSFIDELLKNDIEKLYITGININVLNELSKIDNRLVPLSLNITSIEDIKKVKKICNDVNCLINNAGIEFKTNFLNADFLEKFDKEISVNFKGTVNLTNHFIEILNKNKNSYIINILSIASLTFIDNISSYCISKMALHTYCQYLRKKEETKLLKIFNIYPGYVDTNLVSDIKTQKISPNQLVQNIFSEIEKGNLDIFPDDMSKKYEKSTKLKIDYFN